MVFWTTRKARAEPLNGRCGSTTQPCTEKEARHGKGERSLRAAQRGKTQAHRALQILEFPAGRRRLVSKKIENWRCMFVVLPLEALNYLCGRRAMIPPLLLLDLWSYIHVNLDIRFCIQGCSHLSEVSAGDGDFGHF